MRLVPFCKVTFVLIIVTVYFGVGAQPKRYDPAALRKFKRDLAIAASDTAKIRICRIMADVYGDTATFLSIQYEEQALALANKPGLQKYKHIGFVRMALWHYIAGEFHKAIAFLRKCDPNQLGDLRDKQDYYHTYGIVLLKLGQYDSARIHHKLGLETSKALNDSYLYARAAIDMSNLLSAEGRYGENLNYLIEALAGFKKINYQEGVASTLGNIAITHLKVSNFQLGIEYSLESKTLAQKLNDPISEAYALLIASNCYQDSHQYEKALETEKAAIQIYERFGKKKRLEEAYSILGETLQSLGNKKEAKKAFLTSLNMMRGQLTRVKPRVYNALGNIYSDENQLDRALEYLDSALTVATRLKMIKLAQQSHRLFSEVYSKAGKQDQAYEHLKQFISFNDSSIKLEKGGEIAAIEARYKNQLKEESIRNLQAENKVKDLHLYVLSLIAMITALAASYTYSCYRHNVKARKQLQDLDKLKSQFFINISHEYRTPLSLIMAPLRRYLESGADKTNKQELSMMYRNAERLNTLTNQLLELAKLESGDSKLQVQHTDISALLNMIYSYFHSKSMDNHIHYEFIKPEKAIMGWIDSDKIEHVVCNLLSNAFKFTPHGGTITLKASILEEQLKIEVHDSGIGIPAEQLGLIFNRFYQVTESANGTQGSGIGLTLCKEIIDLHRGIITVSSAEHVGSSFTVTLPVGRHHYQPNEIITDQQEGLRKAFPYEGEVEAAPINVPIRQDDPHPLLLIVEDNQDMNDFLNRTLAESYRVTTALNGAEGWKQASELVPDIIITDIMMPEMDGIEMCRKIRAYEMTSHIPLIMLTAKAEHASRLEGFTTGADVYLAKPFDPKELLINIRNLLKRRVAIQKFITRQHSGQLETSSIELPEVDKIFMTNLNAIMEQHYGDDNFGVDQFAEEAGMSRAQFYRKVNSLAGVSPGELIRDFRLAIACKLLKQPGIQVNEVCYKVGFSSASNFIKLFKVHTGLTPGEYKTRQDSGSNHTKSYNAMEK